MSTHHPPAPLRRAVLAASIAAVVAVAAAFRGAATTPAPARELRPAAPADSALRAEVQALNTAMMAAFHRGDLAGVARFYADDARIVGPGRQTVRGRAAIDRYWTGIKGGRRWRLEVGEVGGSRDEAYQIGVSSLTTAPPGGAERTYTCDFVVIWKRQPDGTLRVVLDLYT